MNTSSALRLKPLLEISEGRNLTTLLLIQNDMIRLAIEQLAISGEYEPSAADVMRHAQALLPEGQSLTQMYARRHAEIAQRPVADLEAVSRHLSVCAKSLERIAGRVLANHPPLAVMAEAEHTIATRYAQILQSSHDLEGLGVIGISQRDQIEKLTDRPDGPLSAFFDKAQVLLAHNQQMPARMRA